MFKIVTFDTKEDGLRTVVKDYQEAALRYLWHLDGEGASSRDIWVNVNKIMMSDPSQRDSISRASIINFMNHMVDEDLVEYYEITGKGGHRRIYSAKYDEEGTKRYLAEKVISKMLETWPEATRATLEAIKGDT
ncbi:unnamed protein product [marine sediment metagenome]|uniref:HTH marR-type domain-containing protein n=1 Tax=marine sediment metagenome TaxID=412755 RepID=X1G723_9ZZZZ